MLNNSLRFGFILLLLLSSSCSLFPKKLSNDFKIIETSIDDVHDGLISHQITCYQLIERYVERIITYEYYNKLNAISFINRKAKDRAKMLDEEYERTGNLKKLHCIPVILKDNFDTADMPTEAGSIALKNSIPPDDAYVVKKLREAGAIIIAKSNMAEWAFSPFETISSTHGETKNAYDLKRVPAGSSGGTASAIAANYGIIGMGTDTGNSIRGPASHLSLVGIRATIGAVSLDGVVPLLLNRDVAGPMMRTVKDTARVFEVIAGYDRADPSTENSIGKIDKSYFRYLDERGLINTRLGVMRELFMQDGADPEVIALMENAIEDLRSYGATVIDEFSVPNYETLSKALGFCSRFQYDIDNYFKTLGDNAPVKSLKEVYDTKLFAEKNIGAMRWAMDVATTPEQQKPPCVDVENDPRRKALKDAVLQAMRDQRIDAIIYPSWSNPPRLIGDDKSPHGNNSPKIPPHTGQPAITVPMGFTSNGLPAGLQFLGKPFFEGKLFQYAYAYEQATRHRQPPAKFGRLNER